MFIFKQLVFHYIYPVEGKVLQKPRFSWKNSYFSNSQIAIQSNFPCLLWISSYFSKQIVIFKSVVLNIKKESPPWGEECGNSENDPDHGQSTFAIHLSSHCSHNKNLTYMLYFQRHLFVTAFYSSDIEKLLGETSHHFRKRTCNVK